MKFFVVILSMYVLGLTVMPCFDAHSAVKSQSDITIVIDNQNGHESIDLCSPFCFCTCCQSLFEFSFEEFILPRPDGIDQFSDFIEKNQKSPTISFWRPPKI